MANLNFKPVRTPVIKYHFHKEELQTGMQLLVIYYDSFIEELQLEQYIMRHLVITDIKPLCNGAKQVIFKEIEGINSIVVQGNDLADLTRYKPNNINDSIGYCNATIKRNHLMIDQGYDIKAMTIRNY